MSKSKVIAEEHMCDEVIEYYNTKYWLNDDGLEFLYHRERDLIKEAFEDYINEDEEYYIFKQNDIFEKICEDIKNDINTDWINNGSWNIVSNNLIIYDNDDIVDELKYHLLDIHYYTFDIFKVEYLKLIDNVLTMKINGDISWYIMKHYKEDFIYEMDLEEEFCKHYCEEISEFGENDWDYDNDWVISRMKRKILDIKRFINNDKCEYEDENKDVIRQIINFYNTKL